MKMDSMKQASTASNGMQESTGAVCVCLVKGGNAVEGSHLAGGLSG